MTAEDPGANVVPGKIRLVGLGSVEGLALPTVGVATSLFGSVKGNPAVIGHVKGVPSTKTAPPDAGNE